MSSLESVLEGFGLASAGIWNWSNDLSAVKRKTRREERSFRDGTITMEENKGMEMKEESSCRISEGERGVCHGKRRKASRVRVAQPRQVSRAVRRHWTCEVQRPFYIPVTNT
jgi:hypothetical protein